MSIPAHVRDFLDHKFFERGAFMKDYGSESIVLGKGGEFRKLTSADTPETFFYLKDFYEDTYLAYFPSETLSLKASELTDLADSWDKKVNFVTAVENEDSLYENDFFRAKAAFGEDFHKVVLVSREEFQLNLAAEGRKHFFVRALNFGTGLPYGIWSEEFGCVGSTPEILFSHKDDQLATFALAGTMAKGQEKELLQSEKNLEEHRLVIKDLTEKLSTIGNDMSIGVTGLLPYKNIVHLKTNIKIRVPKDLSPLKITSLLSPTAALGGYPQTKALQFLTETDYGKRHPQRFFGSAFGLKSHDMNQALVTIRNIQWHGNTFVIESGGGVVPDSDLEKELEEIKMKRESIKGHYL